MHRVGDCDTDAVLEVRIGRGRGGSRRTRVDACVVYVVETNDNFTSLESRCLQGLKVYESQCSSCLKYCAMTKDPHQGSEMQFSVTNLHKKYVPRNLMMDGSHTDERSYTVDDCKAIEASVHVNPSVL